jgi:hypothetical protein
LGCCSDSNVVDAVAGERGIAFQQTDHGLDYEVIGTCLPIHSLFACSTERGANPIHEYDFGFFGHGASSNR